MAEQMEQQSKDEILNAVQFGDIATVEKFLDEGVSVDLTDEEGWSLLHHAAALGQVEVINLLCEKGCCVDLIDNEGRTPLHYAATSGDIETIRLLMVMGSNVNLVDKEGATLFHWIAVFGQNDMIGMLAEHGLDVNIGNNNGLTPLYYAAFNNHVTTFKELVSVGGNIHHKDKFGMKFSDWLLIRQNFVTIKQFCAACGLECDYGDLLGVISALSANTLLDMNRILCLAALGANVSILDAMVTTSYPLNQQKMSKMAIFLSSLSFRSGDKKLPDQFHVLEEPLNPLHISILSEYFRFSQDKKFIEKLTSHPRTRYTVNELFPNGLSPLDVARRFELHDIAVIIERAGGGPGAWADLPKKIEDKAIYHFMSLKELRGRELGEDVISRIVSWLGYPLVISDRQEVKKILEEISQVTILHQENL